MGTFIIPRLRRGGAVIDKKDRGSNLSILMTILFSIGLPNYFATKGIAMLPQWVFYPGIVLMISGIILRQWSMALLGKFFSGTVGTQKDQYVVKNGPYKYVRHPSYTGVLLIFIGLGLTLQSWRAVISLILLFSLAYGYRMHIEEKILISELGVEYKEYKKNTKKLIPYII